MAIVKLRLNSKQIFVRWLNNRKKCNAVVSYSVAIVNLRSNFETFARLWNKRRELCGVLLLVC